MRSLVGILVLALAVGFIVAIVLTPPMQLYASGALPSSAPLQPPPNVQPSPDWGAGLLAATAVAVFVGGIWNVTKRHRAAA